MEKYTINTFNIRFPINDEHKLPSYKVSSVRNILENISRIGKLSLHDRENDVNKTFDNIYLCQFIMKNPVNRYIPEVYLLESPNGLIILEKSNRMHVWEPYGMH